jgi:hypothetical protein
MRELSKFLVFRSGTESYLNRSIFTFSYCCSLNSRICIYFSEVIHLGISYVFMAMFSDEHEQLPPRLYR